ncbi:site-specific recombinase XerD [Tenacibaculum skagerrakense]|uniref:Site-specific recombinase XerD n=1 Tax=Tenacibaculum skagerrakense TaxID=186571 RepID=A0A4R2NWV5_9FLAO|nr:site-specific recombinase XerD [Tenacibaculum skagerrakense]
MVENFHSIYAEYLKQFLSFKRKLGFKFKEEAFHLKKIDEAALETNQSSSGITKSFADIITKKKPNEGLQYRQRRISILAMFSSYLNDIGIDSYIPKVPPCKNKEYLPFIFSQNEINTIFNVCDQYKLIKRHPYNSLFIMPVFLRLLYATGIRFGEALNLKDTDVNLDDNYLLIKDSKNGKERIIPISYSLSDVLKEYLWFRNYLPKNKENYFFIGIGGSKCSQNVRYWFKKILERSNIQYLGKNKGPRVHDLRHTFAVNSLVKMVEAGLDLYVSLPILSTYLGHQSIKATNRYVRLTSTLFPDLMNDIDYSLIDVFPKFKNYEPN